MAKRRKKVKPLKRRTPKQKAKFIKKYGDITRRKFDGKIFYLNSISGYPTKALAKKRAKSLQSEGWKVRVVKANKSVVGKWAIYKRN